MERAAGLICDARSELQELADAMVHITDGADVVGHIESLAEELCRAIETKWDQWLAAHKRETYAEAAAELDAQEAQAQAQAAAARVRRLSMRLARA